MKANLFMMLLVATLCFTSCQAITEEKKESLPLQLAKKGLYLTGGVSAIAAGGLTWALSGDAKYASSWLDTAVVHNLWAFAYKTGMTSTSTDKRAELIAKLARYHIGLRCLSVGLVGTGAFCLKQAFSGGTIASALNSLSI